MVALLAYPQRANWAFELLNEWRARIEGQPIGVRRLKRRPHRMDAQLRRLEEMLIRRLVAGEWLKWKIAHSLSKSESDRKGSTLGRSISQRALFENREPNFIRQHHWRVARPVAHVAAALGEEIFLMMRVSGRVTDVQPLVLLFDHDRCWLPRVLAASEQYVEHAHLTGALPESTFWQFQRSAHFLIPS